MQPSLHANQEHGEEQIMQRETGFHIQNKIRSTAIEPHVLNLGNTV